MADQQIIVVTAEDGSEQRFPLKQSTIMKFESHYGETLGVRHGLTDVFRIGYYFVNKRWPTDGELRSWVDTCDVSSEMVPFGNTNGNSAEASESDPTQPDPALSS